MGMITFWVCAIAVSFIWGEESRAAQTQIVEAERFSYPSPYQLPIPINPTVETVNGVTTEVHISSTGSTIYAQNAEYQLNGTNFYYATALARYTREVYLSEPNLDPQEFMRRLDVMEKQATVGDDFTPALMFDTWGRFFKAASSDFKMPELVKELVNSGFDVGKYWAGSYEEGRLNSWKETLYAYDASDAGRSWMMLYEAAQQNPAVKRVAQEWFARKFTKMSPRANMSELMKEAPNFWEALEKNYPGLANEIKTKVNPNSVTARIKDSQTRVRAQLALASQAVQPKTSPASTSPKTPELREREINETYRDLELQLGLAAKIAFLVGDPNARALARDATIIGTQMLEIGRAMDRFAAGLQSGLMTANVVMGATVSLVSLYQGMGKSDPVIQGLQSISKAIASLRKEIHERFDRIEVKMDQMYSLLVDVYRSLARLEIDLRSTRRGLAEMQMELNRDISAVLQAIETLGDRPFAENAERCLVSPRRYAVQLTDDSYRLCLDFFMTYTLHHSRDRISVGSDDASIRLEDAASELSMFPNGANLPYLVLFVGSRSTEIVDAFQTTRRVPNPIKWSAGAQAYAQLVLNPPRGRIEPGAIEPLLEIQQDGSALARRLDWMFGGEGGVRLKAVRKSFAADFKSSSHQVVDVLARSARAISDEQLHGHDLWDEKLKESDQLFSYPAFETCSDYELKDAGSTDYERVNFQLRLPMFDKLLAASAPKTLRYYLTLPFVRLQVCFSNVRVDHTVDFGSGSGALTGMRVFAWKTRARLLVVNGKNDGNTEIVDLFDKDFSLSHCGNMTWGADIVQKCWDNLGEDLVKLYGVELAKPEVLEKIQGSFSTQVRRLRRNALQDAAARASELNDTMGIALRRIDGIRALSINIYALMFERDLQTSEATHAWVTGDYALPGGNDLLQAMLCNPIGDDVCAEGIQKTLAKEIWAKGPLQASIVLNEALDRHDKAFGAFVSAKKHRSYYGLVDAVTVGLTSASRDALSAARVGSASCKPGIVKNLVDKGAVNLSVDGSVQVKDARISLSLSEHSLAGTTARMFLTIATGPRLIDFDVSAALRRPRESAEVILPVDGSVQELLGMGIRLCSTVEGTSPGIDIDKVVLEYSTDDKSGWQSLIQWQSLGWIGSATALSPTTVFLRAGD